MLTASTLRNSKLREMADLVVCFDASFADRFYSEILDFYFMLARSALFASLNLQITVAALPRRMVQR